jgi:hypothetical protein
MGASRARDAPLASALVQRCGSPTERRGGTAKGATLPRRRTSLAPARPGSARTSGHWPCTSSRSRSVPDRSAPLSLLRPGPEPTAAVPPSRPRRLSRSGLSGPAVRSRPVRSPGAQPGGSLRLTAPMARGLDVHPRESAASFRRPEGLAGRWRERWSGSGGPARGAGHGTCRGSQSKDVSQP